MDVICLVQCWIHGIIRREPKLKPSPTWGRLAFSSQSRRESNPGGWKAILGEQRTSFFCHSLGFFGDAGGSAMPGGLSL